MNRLFIVAVLCVLAAVLRALWPSGDESEAADERIVSVAPSEADCKHADALGESAAEAMGATGVQSKFATKFARDVGRRGWSTVKHQSCPEKD